jgi:hypothetical protein
VRLVCEIGTELGGSTRYLLEQLPYTSCVCIDPWPDGYKLPKEFFDNSPGLENQKASVLQLFLYFCRAYRSRILPIRAFSVEGIILLNEMGLVPEIFYVDGDHRYIGVLNDLILIHHLFPSALIIGDYWNFSSNYPVYKGIERSVQKAALDFADHFDFRIDHIKNTYVLQPDIEKRQRALNYTVG